MFEDYYLNDPALQGLLAAAGTPATTIATSTTTAATPATTAATSATTARPYDLSGLAGLDLSNLYGMNFGSDFGSGGAGGGIYETNPDLQMFQAPLSNKGNPTAYAGNYISVTSPTQVFRLFDRNTGEVVYEGVGYEGAQEVIRRASALTEQEGARAQWEIQTPNSQQESGYSIVASEKRNQSTLGDIASVVLPVGMAILTGGMSLPAQIAGGAIAGAAGAGLAGRNPVTGALLSGATAGLGNVTGLNEAVGGVLNDVGGAVSDALVSGAANQAVSNATGDIVVNALSNLAQGVGAGVVQGAVGGAVGGAAGASSASTAGTGDIVVTGNQAAGATTGAATSAGTGGLLNAATGTGGTTTGATADDTIVVTGNQTTGANTGAATTAGTGGLLNTAGTTGDIVVTGNQTTGGNTGAATTAGTTGLVNTGTGTGDIVVTGNRTGAVTDTATGAVTGAATTGLLNTLTGGTSTGNTTTSERGGVLGTGLSLSDLLTLGGTGVGLLRDLLAGSGGTGTTSTYVSPFGTGTGLGTGQDMRANPNITDYERYGFGPEAMFFTPAYSSVFSAGNPATQTRSTTTTTTNR
jgi:hypothetical protein